MCFDKCECNRHCKRCEIRTTAVTVADSTLTLTIPNQVFDDREKICLIVCQNIPATAEDFPVVILDNGVSYPMLVECGEQVRADQLDCKGRACYPLRVCSTPNTFIFDGKKPLKCTKFVYPQVGLPATTGAA